MVDICLDFDVVSGGAREVMDGVREFLEAVRQHQLAKGHFLGLLHILIGRTITRTDGTVISAGLTWRQLSEVLKLVRWDREQVRELGLNPDDLPPRDRQRYWYTAIGSAQVSSTAARADGDRLIPALKAIGYKVQ
jgi:hypothetical protein